MLGRSFTLVFLVMVGLSGGCGEPDRVVLAVPGTGMYHQAGDVLYDAISQGFPVDEIPLSRGDSGCDETQAASMAEQIVADKFTTQLVIGPYCYEAWQGAHPVLQQAGIAQLPIIPAESWEALMAEEARLLASFARNKLHSKATTIAYVSSQYGTMLAAMIKKAMGDSHGVRLLPLSGTLQTTGFEVGQMVKQNPTALMLIAYYPKAREVLEEALSYGLNSVIMLSSITEPGLLLMDIPPRRLRRARFIAAIENPSQAKDLPGLQAELILAQARYLLKDGKPDENAFVGLPTPPPLRLVYINREGEFGFDSGL